MISKEEREKDKAICEAAPDSLAMMVDDVGRIDLVSENTSLFGYDPIAVGVGEAFAAFAIRARKALPAYIADAEEMERRIAKVEAMARTADEACQAHRAAEEWGRALEQLERHDALREALRVLRGAT